MSNNLLGILMVTICLGGAGFMVFTVLKGIVKRYKLKDKDKLYAFKRRNLAGILPFIYLLSTVYFDFYNKRSMYKWGKSNVKVENILDYFNSRDIYFKIVLICLLLMNIMYLLDIVMLFIFKSGLCKEGIILYNGKFLPWSDINRIDYRNTVMRYSKIIHVYISDKKYEVVYIKYSDIKKVLSIIYSNSKVDVYETTMSYDVNE